LKETHCIKAVGTKPGAKPSQRGAFGEDLRKWVVNGTQKTIGKKIGEIEERGGTLSES